MLVAHLQEDAPLPQPAKALDHALQGLLVGPDPGQALLLALGSVRQLGQQPLALGQPGLDTLFLLGQFRLQAFLLPAFRAQVRHDLGQALPVRAETGHGLLARLVEVAQIGDGLPDLVGIFVAEELAEVAVAPAAIGGPQVGSQSLPVFGDPRAQGVALAGQAIQADFLPHLDADPAAFERGDTAIPALKYFILFVRPQQLFVIAESKDPDHIFPLMDVIQERFQGYPGMRAFASRGSIITSNEGGTRSINLDFSGPRLASIYDAAASAYDRAQTVFDSPRIQARPATLSLSQPMVEVHPDWDRASELGLSAGELGFTVAALTDGAFVDEFFLGDDKIDIFLYGESGPNVGVDGLGQIPVHTPQGTTLPLSAMADIRQTVDTSNVRRIDGRRTVTLNVIPPRDVPLETGIQRVRSEVIDHLRRSGDIPNDVSVGISGASDQLQATRQALEANYLVAGALIYLLMVAIFRHWGYPLLIMTAIPLGVAGGILGLRLLNGIGGGVLPLLGFNAIHQPFDMIAMLGFLILMGTVVNNPILIVHRAVANARQAGMAPREAVTEAVESRLRPIAMSTITTIFGLAPLVLIPGEGTELYRGMGAIVLFGILGAAMVALTFLPALTMVVLHWRQRLGR